MIAKPNVLYTSPNEVYVFGVRVKIGHARDQIPWEKVCTIIAKEIMTEKSEATID